MNIIYRKATPNDASALLKHVKTVGGETQNLSYSALTFNISEEKEARFINRFYNSENDIMLVACDGDIIAGNAIVERNRVERYKHRAEISITVLKDYWGRGIGSSLMEMMIDFAKKSGLEILFMILNINVACTIPSRMPKGSACLQLRLTAYQKSVHKNTASPLTMFLRM